jgi:hypothetical protein
MPIDRTTEAEWSALEEVLRESLDGFEVLDRGLQLDGAPSLAGTRRADLAGVNRAGQLVLVHALPRRDELLEAAVDLLSSVRERKQLIARHLGDARLDPGKEPIAALVVDGVEPAGLAALRALRARELRLFERVRVASGRATSSWVVPVDLAAGAKADDEAQPLLEWMQRVDEARRPLADRALESLLRIDPELLLEVAGEEVRGRFRDHDLARLRCESGRPVLALPDGDGFELERTEDLERALDRVLRLHLKQLDDLPRGTQVESEAALDERLPLAMQPPPGLSSEELSLLRG